MLSFVLRKRASGAVSLRAANLVGCMICGMVAGCSTSAPKLPFVREKSPQEVAQEAATERFETCMDSTLASFGPFRFGRPEARLKAAEICKDVMRASE
jgi:hypothetical protein